MMPDMGTHQTKGSSGQGLTFVRPLPSNTSTPQAAGEQGSSVRQAPPSLAERLFPPRSLEDSSQTPPVTGLELGHFIIEERIGRGGMGAVFRALDTRLDRVVALKVLSTEHSSDPEAVIRFQNEARAAARLDHDNIARVHYIGEEHGLHFIAFEFVTGTNVRNFIVQKGRISPPDAVNYTLQIAEALRHTAASQVVHRDIKPSNIIISPMGRAKLVDLGLARNTSTTESRELTVAGTALGTFDYIAPEQAMDARNVDVRTDIYSLGCTLYHMLTGEPPYPKGTMFEKVMHHHGPVSPDPSLKNPRVSPQLARVVQRMMASNPDERYATPDSLIADLVQIAESMGLEPSHPESIVWSTPLFSPRFKRWDGVKTWMGALLILLMLVFLIDRLQLNFPRSTPQALPYVDLQQPESPPVAVQGTTPAEVLAEETVTVPAPDVQSIVQAETPRIADSASAVTVPSTSLPMSPMSVANSVASPMSPPVPTRTTVEEADSLPQSGSRINIASQTPDSTPRTDRLPPRNTQLETLFPGLSQIDPLGSSALANAMRSSQQGTLSGSFTKPDVSQAPADKALVQPRSFMLMSSTGGERGLYSTLASACAGASEEDVIEVRADGIIDIQKTLQITNKRITIRPALGHRPILRFDFSSASSMGALSDLVDAIHVDRGAISIFDMDLEIIVNTDMNHDWAVVTLTNGAELVTRGSSVTITNFGRASVTSMPAFVHVPTESSTEIVNRMTDRMVTQRSSIRLQDTVLRGEMDFALQRDVQAVSYELTNVALAISGTMFRVDGSNAYTTVMDSDDGNVVNVALTHVTAMTGEGLLWASSGEHGSLPRFEVTVQNSLLRVSRADNPLIEISGHENSETLQNKFKLIQRGASYYRVNEPVGTISSTTSLFSSQNEMKASQIGLTSEQIVDQNLVKISTGRTDLENVQLEDFMLRTDISNPALHSSTDRQDAGVNWTTERLPESLPISTSRSALVPNN